MTDESYLAHYGTPHVGTTPHSGRYKYGSGEKWRDKDPVTGRNSLLAQVARLREEGITNSTAIAEALGMTTTEYRARYSVAFNEEKQANISKANRLHDQGWSNVAIGKEMGVPESTVRGWLKPAAQARRDIALDIADKLEASIPKNGAIDIGAGTELYLGVSADKLKTSIKILEDKGYTVRYLKENQLTTGPGKKTTIKVLCAPGVDVKGEEGLYQHRDRITYLTKPLKDLEPGTSGAYHDPVSLDSKRVKVVYAEDEFGGSKGVQRDGVMLINPNAIDLRLPPGVHYAQVRILVDGDHYLKGMAMYGNPDDFPKGTDLAFCTNKHRGTPKMDVLKPAQTKMENGVSVIDKTNPFKGAVTEQPDYIDPVTGKKKHSPINILSKEGDWEEWSRNLPSQMLSKQSTELAQQQLGIALDRSRLEYDEIRHLTNPVVKKQLLKEFSDQCDSDAVALKAANMPRQKTHVILPINSLKDNEIFAPNYDNGEKVVLVRFPHAGTFEMPELVMNNRNKEGLKYITGEAKDAVGINHHVAQILSGADFDGDTVLVIPNNKGRIKTSKPLSGLKDFDPSERYALPKDIKSNDPRLISPKGKQMEMGKVSNLITDMTIKGADPQDIERAVRHSMVVIDSEKHKLDYKQSYKDNGIEQLKKKYQGVNDRGQAAGASTLISRAKSPVYISDRKPRSYKNGGPIDPVTGEKMWEPSGKTRSKAIRDSKGNIVRWETVPSETKSTRLAEAKSAFELSSGTAMEAVYARFSNSMKTLANNARKEYLATEDFKVDPVAKKKYAANVSKMVAQLNEAKKNAPLQRQALLIANERVTTIKKDHPEYDSDDIKKISNRELKRARERLGIESHPVQITDEDWEAIQAHAVSANRLSQILQYADSERVRELATPRNHNKLPAWSVARAQALLAQGLTNKEVADALGISESTLSHNL